MDPPLAVSRRWHCYITLVCNSAPPRHTAPTRAPAATAVTCPSTLSTPRPPYNSPLFYTFLPFHYFHLTHSPSPDPMYAARCICEPTQPSRTYGRTPLRLLTQPSSDLRARTLFPFSSPYTLITAVYTFTSFNEHFPLSLLFAVHKNKPPSRTSQTFII